MKAVNLSAASFAHLTAVMAATTLLMRVLQRLDFDPEYGLDKHFFPRAKSDGKRIVPLETVDFQISLLTDMPKEEGDLIMKTTLRDLDRLKQEFDDLLKAWQTGDAQKLDEFLNEAKQEAPLIFNRCFPPATGTGCGRSRNYCAAIKTPLSSWARVISSAAKGSSSCSRRRVLK